MKNRIAAHLPRGVQKLNLERPSITDPNLVLKVGLRGFIVFTWLTGTIFYQSRYHVDTNQRVGWTMTPDIDTLKN